MAAFRLPADDLEYAVLRQLWELGTASVRELHAGLGRQQGLVYTTIAKVVDRLRDKGLIQRQRHGQAFVYRAKAAPEAVERARARAAVSRLLGQRPHGAVAALVQAIDEVDPALLQELERAVAARRRSRDGA
jgi:BlaI family transcriptional regulator, penicillinase repressor